LPRRPGRIERAVRDALATADDRLGVRERTNLGTDGERRIQAAGERLVA
jgi:hypothetical protein